MASSSEIEKLERRYSENPDGRFFAPLADAYRKGGQVDRALELVRSGLAKHPDYLSAHIVLGRCLLDKGADADALATFQAVLGLDSENIIALKSLAEIAERGGRTDEAREWLTKLLVVDSMNTEAEADLQRLGGPLAAPAAAESAPVAEAAAPETSFADVAKEMEEPAAPAPVAAAAPEPVAAAPIPEPEPPQPPSVTQPEPAITITEAPTQPIEALPLELEPVKAEAPPPAPPPAAPEPAVAQAPPDLGVVAIDTAKALAEGAAAGPSGQTGGLDLMPFDDSLAWGTGERSSRAIRAEDLEVAEHVHDDNLTTPAVEFMTEVQPGKRTSQEAAEQVAEAAAAALPPAAPNLDFMIEAPPDQSLGGMAPPHERPANIELPADMSGTYSIVDDSADDLVAEPEMAVPLAEAAPPPPAPPPPVAEQPVLSDLPLIMPEDVTPPEELARPSAKMVQVLSPPPREEAGGGAEPMVTETMGDLYLRQGFRSEAADVYRRLLAQRPSDAALAAKLRDAEGPPPDLSASAQNAESVGVWLKRVAGSRLSAPAAAPEAPAPGPQTPSPLEAAFAAPVVEPDGEPAHPARDAFSLDQIFGASGQPHSSSGGGPTASAPSAPPAPATPPSGSSFDEFFGHAPERSVRPTSSRADARAGGDEDLSAFSAWLQGLKK